MTDDVLEEKIETMTDAAFMFFAQLHAQISRYLKLNTTYRDVRHPDITQEQYTELINK